MRRRSSCDPSWELLYLQVHRPLGRVCARLAVGEVHPVRRPGDGRGGDRVELDVDGDRGVVRRRPRLLEEERRAELPALVADRAGPREVEAAADEAALRRLPADDPPRDGEEARPVARDRVVLHVPPDVAEVPELGLDRREADGGPLDPPDRPEPREVRGVLDGRPDPEVREEPRRPERAGGEVRPPLREEEPVELVALLCQGPEARAPRVEVAPVLEEVAHREGEHLPPDAVPLRGGVPEARVVPVLVPEEPARLVVAPDVPARTERPRLRVAALAGGGAVDLGAAPPRVERVVRPGDPSPLTHRPSVLSVRPGACA